VVCLKLYVGVWPTYYDGLVYKRHLPAMDNEGESWMKRYGWWVVGIIVVAVVIIVVIVVVVSKKKNTPAPPSDPSGPVAARAPLLVFDISVDKHPALAKVYDMWIEDLKKAPLPPPLPNPKVLEMWEASSKPLDKDGYMFFNQVELYLKKHHERPWGKEEVGGNPWWSDRFGKYVRTGHQSSMGELVQALRGVCGAMGSAGERNDDSIFGGYFYYPPSGCREWHTNQYDALGWRGYFVHAKTEGKSSLNIMDPQTGFQSFPDKNRTLRLFKVTRNPPLWHSVVSSTDRFSLGFRLSEACAQALIKL